MTTRRTFLGWLAGAAGSAVLPVAALLRCEPEVYVWLDCRTFATADAARWFSVPVDMAGGLLVPASFKTEWLAYMTTPCKHSEQSNG